MRSVREDPRTRDSRAFWLFDSLPAWVTGNSTPVLLDGLASVCWSLCCFRLRWECAGFEVLLGAYLLAIRSISFGGTSLSALYVSSADEL